MFVQNMLCAIFLRFFKAESCSREPPTFYPYGQCIYLIATDAARDRRFKQTIGPGLEAWNGLYGAVKIGSSNKLLYNCDGQLHCLFEIRFESE